MCNKSLFNVTDRFPCHALYLLMPLDLGSPGGIPARNVKGERLLLFLGIIDILQSFRLKKKLEHTFKSMIHDGVSCAAEGFTRLSIRIT